MGVGEGYVRDYIPDRSVRQETRSQDCQHARRGSRFVRVGRNRRSVRQVAAGADFKAVRIPTLLIFAGRIYACVAGRALPNREIAIGKRSKVPVDSVVYQSELR